MLEEFRTVGLTDAARRLGCDPFDVVHLLVAAGRSGADFTFDAASLEHLQRVGGIQASWWAAVSLPADASTARARVRAAVQLLQMRGHTGESRTRLDNVWRGLSGEDQVLLRNGLQALADDGLLETTATSVGVMVSIPTKALDQVQQFVAGRVTPPALQAALEG
jgi:hypothetical protein